MTERAEVEVIIKQYELNRTHCQTTQTSLFRWKLDRIGLKRRICRILTWQQATTQVASLNTIAALVFHINYYVNAILKVLQGHSLDAHDKYSFNLPILTNQAEWEKLQEKTFSDAEKLAASVEALPESKLWQVFSEEKYGDYYRNIHGVIEHTHYHLGQIVLIKKMLTSANHYSV